MIISSVSNLHNNLFLGIQPHAATGFRARMLESLLKSEFVAKVAESDWVKKNITGKAITLQLQVINQLPELEVVVAQVVEQ